MLERFHSATLDLIGPRLPFRVELWDRHDQHIRWVIAASASVAVGHAALDAAIASYPDQAVHTTKWHPGHPRTRSKTQAVRSWSKEASKSVRLSLRGAILRRMKVQEIAEAIAKLPPDQLARFRRWFTAFEPGAASRRWSQCPSWKALSEDLPPAQDRVAAEVASDHHKPNDTPRRRQVSHAAPITAMHAPGNRSARWTKTKSARRADGENGPVCLVERTFDNKPTRHQTGAAKCLLHGADSPKGSATRIKDCIKFESEPNLNAD
jgi:hypothetical protein